MRRKVWSLVLGIGLCNFTGVTYARALHYTSQTVPPSNNYRHPNTIDLIAIGGFVVGLSYTIYKINYKSRKDKVDVIVYHLKGRV